MSVNQGLGPIGKRNLEVDSYENLKAKYDNYFGSLRFNVLLIFGTD